MSIPEKDTVSFDHVPSREELLAAYQKKEEADPASLHYKRHLVRPKLHPWRVLLLCLAALCLATLWAFASYLLLESVLWAVLLGLALLFLILILFARRIFIWLVRAYQRFASPNTRERCRFEPSCSEYMILSLQKYGVIRGLSKGYSRIRRCKPPNGGFDLP